MEIKSEHAKKIDTYLKDCPEIGKWPVEIAGTKHILPFYKFPISLLAYNPNNGRLAMERLEWEETNKRKLDVFDSETNEIVRKLLLSLDKDKTDTLKADISAKSQMEPGVITHDGVVINGNRRMAVLELLHQEQPTGKWQFLDAVRLGTDITEKDLWKIEAGLQLSKDKIAEYHPVNELLKIKEGLQAGLSIDEVAQAMYGRTKDEVLVAQQRLELIDRFLEFWGQPNNYGLLKKFGLHEYFIDLQNNLVGPGRKQGLSGRELQMRLEMAFTLLRANILAQKASNNSKDITHWQFRKIGKILEDPMINDAFTQHLMEAKKRKGGSVKDVPHQVVIDDYYAGLDRLEMKLEKDAPIKLITRAINALESIDRKSKHIHEEHVQHAMGRLAKVVDELAGIIKTRR
jgi:hypothetical protein